jgi:hypothetical protein
MARKRSVDVSSIPLGSIDFRAPITKDSGVVPDFTPQVTKDFQDINVEKRANGAEAGDNAAYKQAKAAEARAKVNLIDLPLKIIKDSWAIPSLYRWSEREAEEVDFIDDPDFKVTDAHLDAFDTKYSDKNRAYLKESTSQQDLSARARWVEEDTKREEEISAYGPWTSLFSRMAGALLDPTMLPLQAVAMGSRAWKGATLLQTLGRSAAVGATEGAIQGAVQESMLLPGNTQKGAQDVLAAIAYGGAGGAILGGGLGALSRFTSKGALAAHVADAIDSAAAKDAKELLFRLEVERPALRSKVKPLVGPEVPGRIGPPEPPPLKVYDEHVSLDNKHIDTSIEAHRSNLEALGNKDMTGRKGAALKKELTAKAEVIRADIAEIIDTLNIHSLVDPLVKTIMPLV